MDNGGGPVCGRYLLDMDTMEISNILHNIKWSCGETLKTGEIYPTNTVPMITSRGVTFAKWGFPKWDNKGVVINARVEGLQERRMFKSLVKNRRCIIPANGYFEWKQIGGSKVKEKYLIDNKGKILYMAGLYDTVEESSTQLSFLDHNTQTYLAFAIITKDANDSVSHVHHRMPLIFNKEEMEMWLSGYDLSALLSQNNIALQYSMDH